MQCQKQKGVRLRLLLLTKRFSNLPNFVPYITIFVTSNLAPENSFERQTPILQNAMSSGYTVALDWVRCVICVEGEWHLFQGEAVVEKGPKTWEMVFFQFETKLEFSTSTFPR